MAAGVIFAVPWIASAQSQYSASDIVNHFNQKDESAASAECPAGSLCLPKEGTRAVCIGTGSACAAPEAEAASTEAAGAFDLLITFELGSDRLSPQAESNLREFAAAMSDPALASATFNVDGHTDASGSADFNAALSQRRAKSVVAFLRDLGIAESRLSARGHGETKPRADDPFAAINRRVEATIRTQ
ncbi:MAG: OmpA family protein [Pseudomonadota bacterium]